MKKYLKSQAKKSVSLFLAVLMVLSCWVWMAPEQAKVEAAKHTPLTQYTVTVKWQLVDRKGKYTGGNIKYKTLGDGWGAESGEQTAVSSLGDCLTNNKSYSKSWTTTSFPTVIMVSYEGGNTEWGAATQDANKARCEVLEIIINDKTVWKGNSGYNGANTATFYPDYNAGNDGTSGSGGGTFTWSRPMLAGFNDDTASASDIAVTLNAIGGQDITKTADYNISKYDCYNQYGVKIADPTNYINNGKVCSITEQSTYVSGTKNSDDPLTGEDAADIYATANDKDTVVIKPNLQISNPQGSDGSHTYYLVRKYVLDDKFGGSVTSKVSAAINVTYPKYTVTFDGGVSTAKITADKEYTGSYSAQGYHGTNITVPSKTTADGYTFKEYWSKPQPATGAASYNAAETDFAQPCTSEDYASYLADGGKEENGILTDKDGAKWYDAGKKLDPTSAKTIDVSENKANFADKWYAWWLAKDLSVKFYDVDGTFLGEKLVKSGQTQGAITWPTSKYINNGYTTGAFKFKVDANLWVTTDGTEINKNSYTFTTDLILTPKLTRESFKNKYAVTFIHPNNGGSVAVGTEGTYDYRADIKNYADIAKGKIPAVPADVDGDLQYRYELLGWTSVAPTTGENYHILLEEADFDVNGTAIGLNSDWVVRNDATYYAVYRRYTKTYVVNFNFKDATGADATRQVKFKYGDKLVAPTDYVPYNYVTKGFGYTFANWEYTNGNGVKATFAYSADIAFTSENIEIAGSALEGSDPLEPIVVKAVYGAPVATPYSVTFNYYSETADKQYEEKSEVVTVKNEEFILQDTVNNLNPSAELDDGDFKYTFAKQWEITEGAATVGIGGEEKKAGDKINTADLITLTPTSNITFKAVYGNPIPYYTVTYVDGADTWSDKVLEGSNVPAWMEKVDPDSEEMTEHVPADYKGEGGTYVFQGWYDEKQIDADFKATNGNKITVADKVTGNLTLYSQFKFVADTYLIKFVDHNGVQLSAGSFEKGQNIEFITVVANKAAQTRPADDTYSYVFVGWDKPVPTFCEGADVTFTAVYKSVYNYYDVEWYNSSLVNGEWVMNADALYKTTKHTFNSKLNAPSAGDLQCNADAGEGKKYVFDGWYYDNNGKETKFERGMLVTGEMTFYAKFRVVNEAFEIITIVNGKSTKYDSLKAISDPVAGYLNDTQHNEFIGWYRENCECTETVEGKDVIKRDCDHFYDIDNETVTEDITIYAKFEVSGHDYTNRELDTAPTYFEVGKNVVWCSCDKDKTKHFEDIPVLEDTVAPTGTIYLGDKSWSSDGEAANLTDGEPISIYANAKTDVIITANDEGAGVKVIRAFVFPADTVLTATNYGAAQSLARDVYNAPVDDDGNYVGETNNANFAVKLGDFIVADLTADGDVQYEADGKTIKYKKLESGKSYIVYYYVNDKADTDNGAPATGNQLNRKVRTAKFYYDSEAPVFAVEGNSNNAAVPTYCGTATVTGIEKDVTLKINNEVVTVTYAEGAETGTYVINYEEDMDTLLIVATDKAGNTYSKKIRVNDHNLYTDEKAATCAAAGYKRVYCLNAGCTYVESEETYAQLQHELSTEIVEPDCINGGYTITTCANCNHEVKTDETAALGHDFDLNADGTIKLTTVTASTCCTRGLGEATCKTCNGELEDGYVTGELELDPTNHDGEKKTITTNPADCTNNGSYKETCYCGVVVVDNVIPATGHGTVEAGTAEWVVTTAPTCYEKGEKTLWCLNGDHAVEVDGVPVTKEIAATGEHIKTVSNPETYKEVGWVYYHCATAGCPHKYEPKKYVDTSLQSYTVSFYAEDGETLLYTVTDLEGTGIQKGDVTAPEKAETAESKFSFAGWVEIIENEDGTTTEGNTYKLPLEIPNNDLKLKASYKASPRLYKHRFLVPTSWVATTADDVATTVFDTLVGAYGDVKVPSSKPSYKPTADEAKCFTYKFEGWARTGTTTVIDDFTVYSDADFIAIFSREPIVYDVIFYNGSEYKTTVTVNGGEKVTIPAIEGLTKAYDKEYHYISDGKWYTDSGCNNEFDADTAITETTRLYAGYDAIEHSYTPAVTTEATCTDKGVKTFTCTCGHYYTESIAALGHNMVDKGYDEETGSNVEECSRCGHKELTKASFVVKFINYNGSILFRADVKANDPIAYNGDVPTRLADKQYDYTFKGWYVQGDDTKTIVTDFGVATAEITFVADYTGVTKYYPVSYLAYTDDTVLYTTKVAYGEKLPEYKGDTEILKTLKYSEDHTEEGHYVFGGWNVEASYIVTGDTTVRPVFKIEKHTLYTTNSAATCTKPGGSVIKCEYCLYEASQNATVPALGHTWNEGEITKEPVFETQTPGEKTYTCTVCGETKSEEIAGDSYTLKATVKDENGNPQSGVRVELLKKQADGTYVYLTDKETNTEGVVIFAGLEPGDYRIYVTSTKTHSDATVNEDGSTKGGDVTVQPEKNPVDEKCQCSCHKDNFWGIIYRLIQKIIKFFSGKPSCCACPDKRI